MSDQKQYEIFAALHEESNSPWVWFETDLDSRTIVKIHRPKVNRGIWCQVRVIDRNFLQIYNQPHRRAINDPSTALVISDHYRSRLEIHQTGITVSLEVRQDASWCGELGLYRHHPDLVVRLAFKLGLLSVCLGIVSVCLGVVSLVLSS